MPVISIQRLCVLERAKCSYKEGIVLVCGGLYIGLQEISYLDKHYLSTTPNAIIGWKICIPIGNNSRLALPLKELLGS